MFNTIVFNNILYHQLNWNRLVAVDPHSQLLDMTELSKLLTNLKESGYVWTNLSISAFRRERKKDGKWNKILHKLKSVYTWIKNHPLDKKFYKLVFA